MFSVIKWEIKKCLKPGIIILWLLLLVSSFSSINKTLIVNDMYGRMFNTYYLRVPFMLIIMCTMFSGGFIIENTSNMKGLIKASKGGTKQLVLSKFIANGICASAINLSILAVMVLKAFLAFGFKGLDLPLKDLWYFMNTISNITVLQMLLILSITLILGSFLFAAIGLYLSAINKKATIPFIASGLLLGLPFLEIIPRVIRMNSPINGMYSQELIRFNAPISSWIVFIVTVVVGSSVLYKLTKKTFLKES